MFDMGEDEELNYIKDWSPGDQSQKPIVQHYVYAGVCYCNDRRSATAHPGRDAWYIFEAFLW